MSDRIKLTESNFECAFPSLLKVKSFFKSSETIKQQILGDQETVNRIHEKIKESEGRIKMYLDYIEKEQREAVNDVTGLIVNRHEDQIEYYQELIRIEDKELRNFKSLLGDSEI